MTAHFPFVVLPQSLHVSELARDRPCTCLAVLATASHGKLKLQRSLGSLLNELIASKVAIGPIHSLDMLQGLLVNVAWAHYQPRPRKHTQHLHLAISILCDMRMDRPRQKPELWDVDNGKYQNGPAWNADEMRALAGAYYLSSRYQPIQGTLSSVLMRKSRHFEYTSYLYGHCEHLGQKSQFPTDKHLAYIVGLQKLIEDVDRIMTRDPANASTEIGRVKKRCAEMRASLPFSLHESPPVSMQLSLLELLISQSSLGGSTFGVDKFAEIQGISDRQSHLLEWLSTSISAVQSLISMVLALPAGEERPVSNTAWLAFYCGMALAVRLDLLAARQGPSGAAHHLRRFLDMPNTLRQIAMRFASAAGDEVDASGDRDVFHGMACRSRRLEEWYLEGLGQLQSADRSTEEDTQDYEGSTIAVASSASSGHMGATGAPSQAAGMYAPFDQDHLDTGLYYDADLDFANVLFGDSQGYSVDFEKWTTIE
ncbi:hypothetical protein PG999_014072 [Apiospora kogelbergensis]|uniref:Uncharacterized protein n=1 Tax=Apiospora kogelbergensis TaxID=1337665 RepID=A0AAW0QG75_9PEZI